MDTRRFTESSTVRDCVTAARDKIASRPVSDIKDGEGLQYVDLVLEGGGVLGMALVGYTYVLEQAGLRFLGIAGTSAGAINAVLLAGLGPPAEAKSAKVIDALAAIPLASFVDGDSDARDFTDALVRDRSALVLLWKGLQVRDNLSKDLGLHPGHAFQAWLEKVLAGAGVTTLAALEAKLKKQPLGGYLTPRDCSEDERKSIRGELKLIAADVTTHTKAVLPDMAALYWPDPQSLNPSTLVRASMAIPFFFTPAIAPGGTLGKKAMFVDGGIIYNFPIGVFHQHDRVPLAPTFGVKLQLDTYPEIDTPTELAGAIFDTAREGLQQEFLVDNPDYRHLVANIDTKAHHWLNFNLSDDAKVDLFKLGAERAAEFLMGFDWAHYKEIRRLKAKVRNEAGMPNPALRARVTPQ